MPNFIFNFLNRLIWQSYFASSKVNFLIENANMEFIFSNTDSPIVRSNSCLDKNQRTVEMGRSVDKNPKGSTKLKVLPNETQLINNTLPLTEPGLPD